MININKQYSQPQCWSVDQVLFLYTYCLYYFIVKRHIVLAQTQNGIDGNGNKAFSLWTTETQQVSFELQSAAAKNWNGFDESFGADLLTVLVLFYAQARHARVKSISMFYSRKVSPCHSSDCRSQIWRLAQAGARGAQKNSLVLTNQWQAKFISPPRWGQRRRPA